MLGAREFAEQIGVPYATVALWLRQNRIKEAEAVEVGKLKVYQVPAEAVKLYKGDKARPKKGRPKKSGEVAPAAPAATRAEMKAGDAVKTPKKAKASTKKRVTKKGKDQ